MKFTVQGTSYEFPELQDCTTKELRTIKENSKMGLRKLMEGFYEMDPDAITAVVFVAKTRAGEKVQWEDLDEIRPLSDIEWPDWGTAEEGEATDPPTSGSTGSGTSRTRGSSSTSRSSRTTSTTPPETSTS